MKYWSFIIGAVFSLPFSGFAQSERAQQPPPPSLLETLFFTLLPIFLIGIFIWFFFIRGIRRVQNTNKEHIEAQKRHNETVEKLLERIAKAVEKRNGDAG
jgi:large-conductance mechanosensitive channel